MQLVSEHPYILQPISGPDTPKYAFVYRIVTVRRKQEASTLWNIWNVGVAILQRAKYPARQQNAIAHHPIRHQIYVQSQPFECTSIFTGELWVIQSDFLGRLGLI